MAVTVGPREKAILTQTLAPLLLGLVGHKDGVTVDLKSELQLHGQLQAVDCFMNVTMTEAVLKSPSGPLARFSFLFLQRKSIRAIRIPNDVNLQRLLKEQVDIVTGAKAREERRRARKKRENYLRKKEKKRMETVD